MESVSLEEERATARVRPVAAGESYIFTVEASLVHSLYPGVTITRHFSTPPQGHLPILYPLSLSHLGNLNSVHDKSPHPHDNSARVNFPL